MIFRESSRDWLFVSVVTILVIGANLPNQLSGAFSFDRRILLAALIGMVVVLLVRYIRIALVLAIFVLAIGANVPDRIALEFGIFKPIVLATLVVIVAIPIANQLLKMIPTGNEARHLARSSSGLRMLFSYALQGKASMVQTLVKAGVNVNGCTVSGVTPLMAAAQRGHWKAVEVLVDAGANVNARDSRGRTALLFAESKGFNQTAAYLKGAGCVV